ncbi:MAG: hydrogenase maturation nickel metallochaperone HypA [Nitrospirae bacterium]|nr:hydrogenase maturation nickel metallochaperone HypA [Nitrospirota bacterium]
MHEVSIAQSILDIAITECRKADYKRINSISLRIGKVSGIKIQSLLFAFDIIKIDTIAQGAALICEEVPVVGYCPECHDNFEVVSELILACPECGGARFSINGGRELDIVEIDVD